jgi:hypothetical protein
MQADAARVRGLLFGKKGQASIRIPRNVKQFSDNVSETVDRIKTATSEDGATLNLDGTTYEDGGLVVPAGSLNVAQDDVSAEGLFEFLKDNEENVSSDIFKIGLYKFPDRPEVSYDLNIVIPREYRDVALKFGELTGQESLFDLDTFENIKTGSDGKNPRKFTAQELAEIAKDLSEGRLPKIVGGTVQPSVIKGRGEQLVKGGEVTENDRRIALYAIQNKQGIKTTKADMLRVSKMSADEKIKLIEDAFQDKVKKMNPAFRDPEFISQPGTEANRFYQNAVDAKNRALALVQKPKGQPSMVNRSEERKIKEEANRAKVIEYNKKAKENRGENISLKAFDTIKKRGQDLKIGDVYSRRIGDAVYVFKVLSNLRKMNNQFYVMDVEVLDTGTDYVRQELDPDFDIKEVGKKVGDKSIDSFKNLSSPSGGFNFGEVTVLQDYESKTPETKLKGQPSMVKRTSAEVQQLMGDSMDAVDQNIADGVDAQTAVEDNITSQDWYGELTPKQKEQFDEIIKDEFGVTPKAPVAKPTGVKTTIANIIDNYYKGDRQSKLDNKQILESDPKLKYIYENISSINKQLQAAGVITDKTDGCP